MAHSYEFVKKTFEDNGYILLSKEYVNSKEKLEIICPEKHQTTIVFKNFLNRNSRCFICVRSKPRVRKGITQHKIRI